MGEAIHPLRRRMIEDMTARNLDEATQRGYLRSVRACCRYCGRGPGQLTFEDIRGTRCATASPPIFWSRTSMCG